MACFSAVTEALQGKFACQAAPMPAVLAPLFSGAESRERKIRQITMAKRAPLTTFLSQEDFDAGAGTLRRAISEGRLQTE